MPHKQPGPPFRRYVIGLTRAKKNLWDDNTDAVIGTLSCGHMLVATGHVILELMPIETCAACVHGKPTPHLTKPESEIPPDDGKH